MLAVDAVMVHSRHDRFPSFGFDLPARTRAAIVVGSHLGEDAIAESEGRIAETFQVKALQQFVIDRGAGNHNFRAPGTNAFDLSALRHWQASQSFRDLSH